MQCLRGDVAGLEHFEFRCVANIVRVELPAGPQHRFGQVERVGVDAAVAHVFERRVDVVFDSAEFHLAILDDGIRRARVAVARLADASGIDDGRPIELQRKRNVRVSDQNEVGVDAAETRFPRGLVITQIFVEGITRRRMHEKEALAVERHLARHWHPHQVFQVKPAEQFPMQRSRRRRQAMQSGDFLDRNSLRDRVIVIPSHRSVGVLSDPIDAGDRIGSVIHKIADEQARVERFLHRCECRPIRVNIRKH